MDAPSDSPNSSTPPDPPPAPEQPPPPLPTPDPSPQRRFFSEHTRARLKEMEQSRRDQGLRARYTPDPNLSPDQLRTRQRSGVLCGLWMAGAWLLPLIIFYVFKNTEFDVHWNFLRYMLGAFGPCFVFGYFAGERMHRLATGQLSFQPQSGLLAWALTILLAFCCIIVGLPILIVYFICEVRPRWLLLARKDIEPEHEPLSPFIFFFCAVVCFISICHITIHADRASLLLVSAASCSLCALCLYMNFMAYWQRAGILDNRKARWQFSLGQLLLAVLALGAYGTLIIKLFEK